MPALRVGALLLALAVACGGRQAPRLGDDRTCTASRPTPAADGLCETDVTCARAPGGPYDRIGLRRLARCDGATGPVVVYLPGMHMNGTLARAGERPDLRIHLARAGFRTWGVDYRTHAVPSTATPAELAALASWTADVFADDGEAAVAFARRADPGPLWLAGFSYGAGLAYRLAARGVVLDGIVVLDGVPPDGKARDDGGGPAIDVGGTRLPFEARERLLVAVLVAPNGPSPLAGYATAADALADVTYTARSFGGRGGLSAAKDGVTDASALASLLYTYDRWWPRAALTGAPATPARRLRVLAFATTNFGPEWVARVRAGATAFGGGAATVRELPGYGHVDVLVGREAPARVFEPIRAFVSAPPG